MVRTRWEYKRIVFGGTCKGWGKWHTMGRDIDSGEEFWSLEGEYEILSWLGMDGWELTAITKQEYYLFKRELID